MQKRGRDAQSGHNRSRREEAEETAAALAAQGARNRRPRVMDDVGAETRGVGRRLSGAGGMRRARARGELEEAEETAAVQAEQVERLQRREADVASAAMEAEALPRAGGA